MTKHPYTYTVLRYVHDTGVGEFANVGVVVYSKDARFVHALVKTDCYRVSRMFPGMDETHFQTVVGHIQQRFDAIAAQLREKPELNLDHAHAVAFSVIAQDDSSFQWSPMGSGTAVDLPRVAQSIFNRMVDRYDDRETVADEAEAHA